MKKLITTYAFLMLVSGIFATGTGTGTGTFTVGGIQYTTTSTNTVAVMSNSYTGSITIPSTVTYTAVTYNVTSIGTQAFASCTGLTSITIPSSITSIGNNAFQGCSGLTSISIPSFVTSIGNNAFYNCTKLTSITIPSSVTSIGSSAFYNCTGLTSITIPSSVTSMGSFALSGTAWYNSQPDGLVYAGKIAYAYKGDMPANTSITLDAGTIAIASAIFAVSSLTSITIPSSVTSIGDAAFMSCGSLKSLTCLSSTPPILGIHCFSQTTLTDVFVPSDAAVTDYKANADWIAAFPGDIIKKNVSTAFPTLGSNNVKVYATSTEIVIDGLSNGATVELYNLNGLQMQSRKAQGDESVSIGSLPQGLYIVKLITSEGTIERKVIKK